MTTDHKLHKLVSEAFFKEFGTRPSPEGHLWPFAMSIATEALRLAMLEIQEIPGAACAEGKAAAFESLQALIDEAKI